VSRRNGGLPLNFVAQLMPGGGFGCGVGAGSIVLGLVGRHQLPDTVS
jgi:hypothetical protein